MSAFLDNLPTISTDKARANWSRTLDQAQREPVTITHRGRARAVIVEPGWFAHARQALQDAEDVAEARAILASGEPLISHEDVKRELGLD
ncbi:MAG: type II toxin-antitoxin system Phd/YefM family antitoxin [Bifidobacteriaceae bacterium]|nr:type II toxin-antitoxin system Phd/YefM family antitoxin [Bifidobacteriaceae bacterium]